MIHNTRTLPKLVAILVAMALLAALPRSLPAQTETPQEKAEKLREAQEKAAEQRREAQEKAEQQREAQQQRAEQQREAQERAAEQREAQQQRAEQQREAQERAAEQREAQQQRAEQQREAQPREAPPRPSAPPPSYTPAARPPNPAPSSSPPVRTDSPASRPTTPPPGSSGGQTYRPGAQTPAISTTPSSPVRPPTVYTPGASNAAGSGRTTGTSGSGGATVYTPGSQPSRPSAVTSGTGVTSSDGVKTYTIRAPGSSSAVPSGNASPATQPNGGRVFPTATAPVRATPRTVYTAPAASSVASRTPAGTSILNPAGSQAIVKQVNSARAGLRGINSRPLPAGKVAVDPNGNLRLATEKGGLYALRANGTVASIGAQGRAVNFRPDGRVSGVHTATVDIQRGVRGERIIRTTRPDKSILVGTGGRNGYLERTVVVGNRSIIQRTYVTGGRVYARAFVAYTVSGRSLPLYVPSVYFAPAFYGWAFYPWAAPVPYAWGWAGAPWVGYYSGYYQPYAAYQGASAWLTDYLLSQTLANAYAMQNQAPPLPGYGDTDYGDSSGTGQPVDGELYAQNDTPITPDLRNAIADEVGRQLAYENAVASGTAQQTVEELPNSLKPDRVFVVSTTLDVSTADSQVCELTGGDVLRVTAPPASDSPAATLRVASGKRQDCPAGVEVSISVQDLAEMQNNLRAQMDAGLETLRFSQGQGGLPQAPQSAIAPPTRPALDVPLPPDPNVAGLLDAQQRDAQRTELATVQAVAGSNQ